MPVLRPQIVDFVENGITVVENLTYTENIEDRLSMDCFFDGKTPAPRPVIVWIHGGGCIEPNVTRLSRPENAFLELCKRGYFIASVDYHLSQDIPFPSQVEDCKCAVRFLRSHAEAFGIDPDRIGVWGESCGGQIAGLLAVEDGIPEFEGKGWLSVPSKVQAAVSWYGAFDTLSFTHLLNDPNFSVIYGGTLEEKRDIVIKGSPINYVNQKVCPFLAMCSNTDNRVPDDQTVRFCDALNAAGNHAEHLIVPNQGHGYFQGQEYYDKVFAFLDKYLKK